jgi:hypothetical protein
MKNNTPFSARNQFLFFVIACSLGIVFLGVIGILMLKDFWVGILIVSSSAILSMGVVIVIVRDLAREPKSDWRNDIEIYDDIGLIDRGEGGQNEINT